MNGLSNDVATGLLVLVILAACGRPDSARAASVGAGGYTNNFDALPAATDWSTLTIGTLSADIASAAQLDAAVQAIAASSITTRTAPDSADPPGALAVATWSSTGFYLQTRPTVNAAVLLMCTLVNNRGAPAGEISISYDFAKVAVFPEEVEGHRVYYSLTGAAGSWTLIPSLSSAAPGWLAATLSFTWPTGANMYLVWADDNGSPSPDTGNQIDNFFVGASTGTQTPIAITNQPQSQTVNAGSSVVFTVGVSGSSPLHQWQRDNGSGAYRNIPGAINPSYIISNAQSSHSGSYRSLVNNAANSVTSVVATLTVIEDRTGPRMLRAYVDETGSTNTVIIEWNERLWQSSSSRDSVNNSNNYRVTLFGTTNTVPVTAVLYTPGSSTFPPPACRLRLATNNWYLGGASNYYVTVNRIRDNSANTNIIAPDSQIALAWPHHTNVLSASAIWRFHAASIFDPDVFNQPWYSCDYVEGPWWAEGVGPFCGGPVTPTSCFSCVTEIGYQPEPMLFRTSFVWPPELGAFATLRVMQALEDGAIFYLNGIPISWYNAPGSVVNVSRDTRANSIISSPVCATNSVAVTNLMAGTNWVAVAVLNSTWSQDATIVFVLQVDAVVYVTGSLSASPSPVLNIAATGTNQVRLSWTGAGYALESATNFVHDINSPLPGSWIEVPNMSNPYTNTAADAQRFYRLRK